MTETVIYRGPTGATIEVEAAQAALEEIDCRLTFNSEPEDFAVGMGVRWRAEIQRKDGVVVDSEEGEHPNQVEGVARLLRRVLPNPAQAIAHFSVDAHSPEDFDELPVSLSRDFSA